MIDSHCHIDDEQYLLSLDTVIRRQQDAGVEAIVVPGVNENSVHSVFDVCRHYPGYLYPAMGLHPEDVRADHKEVLARMREAIEAYSREEGSSGIFAVGEVGLDYHFSTEFKEEQKEAFRIQLDWAREWNLPVIVHARDASEDAYNLLLESEACRQGVLRGVMHCYSGSYEMAMKYISMGMYLGIGGVITFKNCRLAENLVPSDGHPPVPLDRLLLETDAPYMTPVPFRGQPNESRYMCYVVDKLAEVYRVSREEVIMRTNAASRSLFGLK